LTFSLEKRRKINIAIFTKFAKFQYIVLMPCNIVIWTHACNLGWNWTNIYGSSAGWLENTRFEFQIPPKCN
jgi:hypothetical protein